MPRPRGGLRRSDAHALALRCDAHIACTSAPRPASSDLSQRFPVRLNQGQTPTCYAHALAAGLSMACGVPWIPSPRALAVASMRLEQGPGGTLRDDGCRLTTVLDVARQIGTRPMQAPTPDGRCSDVWCSDDVSGLAMPPPPNDCLDLTPAELDECRLHEYDCGLTSIDPRLGDAPGLVVDCLTSPLHPAPVLVGTIVGPAFSGLRPGYVAQPEPAWSVSRGGHALLLVGHRTAADGSVEFKILNSWGEEWDENGECWVSTPWLRACWELHPLTPVPRVPSLFERLRSMVWR